MVSLYFYASWNNFFNTELAFTFYVLEDFYIACNHIDTFGFSLVFLYCSRAYWLFLFYFSPGRSWYFSRAFWYINYEKKLTKKMFDSFLYTLQNWNCHINIIKILCNAYFFSPHNSYNYNLYKSYKLHKLNKLYKLQYFTSKNVNFLFVQT